MASMAHSHPEPMTPEPRKWLSVSLESILQMAVLSSSIIGGAYVLNYRVDRIERQSDLLREELAKTTKVASNLTIQVQTLNDGLGELNRLLVEKRVLKTMPVPERDRRDSN